MIQFIWNLNGRIKITTEAKTFVDVLIQLYYEVEKLVKM